jgi:hypothetical protein
VQPSREKRIPQLPDGLANPPDGEKMIIDRHAELLCEMAGDANLVRAEFAPDQVFRLARMFWPETIRQVISSYEI